MLFERFYPLIEKIGDRDIRCHSSSEAAVNALKESRPDVWSTVISTVSEYNHSPHYSEYVVHIVEQNCEGKQTPVKKEKLPNNLESVSCVGVSLDDELEYAYISVFVVFRGEE